MEEKGGGLFSPMVEVGQKREWYLDCCESWEFCESLGVD
jgi:hypothetical protein